MLKKMATAYIKYSQNITRLLKDTLHFTDVEDLLRSIFQYKNIQQSKGNASTIVHIEKYYLSYYQNLK